MKTIAYVLALGFLISCSAGGGGGNGTDRFAGPEPRGTFQANKDSENEFAPACSFDSEYKLDSRLKPGMSVSYFYLRLGKNNVILGADQQIVLTIDQVLLAEKTVVKTYRVSKNGLQLSLQEKCIQSSKGPPAGEVCETISQDGVPLESLSEPSSQRLDRYCYVRSNETGEVETSGTKGVYTFSSGLQVEAYRRDETITGTIVCRSYGQDEPSKPVELGAGTSRRVDISSVDIPAVHGNTCGAAESVFSFHEVLNEKGERVDFYRSEKTDFKF